MKIVSARDFSLQREVDYGTPEQNEAVRTIIHSVRQEGMRLSCGIRDRLMVYRW